MGAPQTRAADRRFLLLLLAAGLALRLIWLVNFYGGIDAFAGSGEATRVALALARTGSFADAYYPGYGPTAHLLPLSPAAAGAILWLFGPGTGAANVALLGWSLAQVAAAYWLLARLFARLGADPLAIRWGLALLCLLPVFVSQEMVDFRYWEGASAVSLICLNLLLLLRLDQRPDIGWRGIAAIAALSAVTFFLCPPAGLAVDACWAIFALRRLRPLRIAQLAASSALAVGLLVTPWAIRNERVLGTTVLLRSNAGLELALANHPAALSSLPPERVFADRLLAVHPYHSLATRTALARDGGEVAYASRLGAETGRWIAAHPLDFVRLCLRHLRQFYFPEPWQMYFTAWEGMRTPRSAAIGLVDLLGMIGLVLGLRTGRRGYALLAVIIVLVALPYALVQPIQRYTYLLYGLFAFLSVEALLAGFRYARGKGPGWAR